jgi:hypothetical protein
MTRRAKFTCSGCGGPFHGPTPCPPDGPLFVAARAARVRTLVAQLKELRVTLDAIERELYDLGGDPMFGAARQAVDDVLGRGAYARLNRDNPGVPLNLRRGPRED